MFEKELNEWKREIIKSPLLENFNNFFIIGDYYFDEDYGTYLISMTPKEKGIMEFKCLYLTYYRLNFDSNSIIKENKNKIKLGLPSLIIENYKTKITGCYAYDNIYYLINHLKEMNDKLNNIKLEKILSPKYFENSMV